MGILFWILGLLSLCIVRIVFIVFNICVYVCVCTCVYKYMYMCVYVCVYVYVYVYIYIYVYMLDDTVPKKLTYLKTCNTVMY